MSFKNMFNQLFSYTPTKDYEFRLPNSVQVKSNQETNENVFSNTEKVDIFPSLSVNREYITSKYSLLINSDIVLREFTLNARGKQYNAFIIYIDGMADSQIIDDFILKPLMLRNKNNLYDGSQNKVISEAVANNITVRKVKKFDLSNYLMGCLMPQNDIQEVSDFDAVSKGVNSGNCV